MGTVRRTLRRRLASSALIGLLSVGTAVAVSPGTALAHPGDGLCTGRFVNGAVDVLYRRDPDGRQYWNTWLSPTAMAAHTSPVTVTMPYAYLNGQPIAPPYGPHTASVNYDFHGSVQTVTFLGGGGSRRVVVGDRLTLSWFIDSVGATSFGQVECVIPDPGAG